MSRNSLVPDAPWQGLLALCYTAASAPAFGGRTVHRAQDLDVWAAIMDALAEQHREGPDGACRKAAEVARARARLMRDAVGASAFNRARILESRAAYWDAAASALQQEIAAWDGDARVSLEQARAQAVRRADRLRAKARGTAPQSLADPREVLGKTAKRGRPTTSFDIDKLETPLCDERALAIAWLEKARRDAATAFRRAGGTGPLPVLRRMDAQYRLAWNEHLNRRALGPIVRTLPLIDRSVSELRTYRCVQTPASALAPLKLRYGLDRLHGSNCHDIAQYRHATNLFRSELRDRSGRPLLTLFRHGAHSAVAFTVDGIREMADDELADAVIELNAQVKDAGVDSLVAHAKGKQALARYIRTRPELLERFRHAANVQRAREAVEAALSDRIGSLRQEAQRTGRRPKVTLCSISLMSPDRYRELAEKHGEGSQDHRRNERRMWNDQLAAWKAVSGRAIEVQGVDVEVDVLAMNFAINKEAFDHGWFGPLGIHAHGADLDALGKLLGDDFRRRAGSRSGDWRVAGFVGEALARMRQPRRGRVEKLARQVGDLFISKRYQSASNDPYKLASRVAVLCDMVGLPTLINCKSGKDRTSEEEAHARLLRIQLEHGDPPEPGAPLTPTEQQWLAELHENGGAREIQRWNTNHAGTKLKFFSHLHTGRYGFRDKQDEGYVHYQGLSKLVEA